MLITKVTVPTKKLLEFPFRYVFLPSVGKVFYPYIPVFLPTVAGWKDFDFIVDTGADFTTVPHRMGQVLGTDLKKCKQSQVGGIGGAVVKTWETEIEIKIKNYPVKIRCSIAQDDETPFLLGRIDLLDTRFSWHFDSRAKKIIFELI